MKHTKLNIFICSYNTKIYFDKKKLTEPYFRNTVLRLTHIPTVCKR